MTDKSIKKLRFRFWLFLMAAFSAVIVCSLTIVYVIFSHQVQQEIREWLDSPDFIAAFREREPASPESNHVWQTGDAPFTEQILNENLQLTTDAYALLMDERFTSRNAVHRHQNEGWIKTIQQIFDFSDPSVIKLNGRYFASTFLERFEDPEAPLEFLFIDQKLNAISYTRVSETIPLPGPQWEEGEGSYFSVTIMPPPTFEDIFIFSPSFDMLHLMPPGFERPYHSVNLSLIFADVTDRVQELYEMRDALIIIGGAALATISVMSFIFSLLLTEPIHRTLLKHKQFIGDASHELKTPLSILQSNYDVLLENPEATIKSQMEWLEYMGIGFERMNHLTRDLLTLARLEYTPHHRQEFELGRLLENAAKVMKKQADAANITLAKNIELGMFIKNDPDRLAQVLFILLDNAVKYAGTGGWVEITALKYRRKTIIKISNSGPGIPKKELSRIFERFYRVDGSRNSQDGSFGLGLAIAREIIQKSGGKLTAESIPGKRTEFTIRL